MPRCSGATAWCDHYDVVQTCAVVLLYMQVHFPFLGSAACAFAPFMLGFECLSSGV